MLRSEISIAKNGSIILFVLLVSSTIMSMAYIFWQRSILYAHCMDERMLYEQQISLLDGAVRYGIIYAQHHALMDGIERVINLDAYAQLMRSEYHLNVHLSRASADNITVCAELYHHVNHLHSAYCLIALLPNEKVKISEWHIN